MKMMKITFGIIIVSFLFATSVFAATTKTDFFPDLPQDAWLSMSDINIRPLSLMRHADLMAILDEIYGYMEKENADLLQKVQDIELPATVQLDVPFTSQAPHANWHMPYQEACEEASIIMVKYFLDKEELSADTADKEILTMVDWELTNGYLIDTTAEETGEIATEFYSLKSHVYFGEDVTSENMKRLLAGGHPVILPAAGRLLGNRNFTGAGPAYHMIVLVGYDEENFYVHDPGTSRGKNYKYSYETIENALHDWTGSALSIENGPKAMLILTAED